MPISLSLLLSIDNSDESPVHNEVLYSTESVQDHLWQFKNWAAREPATKMTSFGKISQRDLTLVRE